MSIVRLWLQAKTPGGDRTSIRGYDRDVEQLFGTCRNAARQRDCDQYQRHYQLTTKMMFVLCAPAGPWIYLVLHFRRFLFTCCAIK